MAVTIPTSDITNTALAAAVTQWKALITNQSANPAQAFANVEGLKRAQRQLVMQLMVTPGGPTASGIIASCTYGT
jgi:hypothetical protein